jgi:exopolysaccharide biosynthesis polyprenyl glycosylphosphotransferase
VLVAGDFVIGSVAVLAALLLWSLTGGTPPLQASFVWHHAGWFAAAPAWAAALRPARRFRVAFSIAETASRIAHAALALLVVYLAVYFYAPREALPRLMVLHFLWQATILTFTWRLVYIWVFTATSLRRRIVIVGAGRRGRAILRVLKDSGLSYADVLGFIDDDGVSDRGLDGVPVLGGAAALREFARSAGVAEVILAVDGEPSPTLIQALVTCQEDGLDVVPMASVYEQLLERVPVQYLEPDWIVSTFVDAVRSRDASHIAKRATDVMASVVGFGLLLVLSPVIAVAIVLDSGRPILFTQVRVGRAGRPFWLMKFRTMVSGAEPDGEARWASPGDPRITRVGRWLRRLRLDEWPQIVNILAGEMSLVGPRPERPEFMADLERRIPLYRTRLLVRPGLTGWAQVNFPYGDSIEAAALKLEYDLYYIKHRSLVFDAWIVLRTVGAVIGLKGR